MKYENFTESLELQALFDKQKESNLPHREYFPEIFPEIDSDVYQRRYQRRGIL